MTTIEIQLQDDLIRQFGLEAIRRMITDELAYQRFRLLENNIQEALQRTEGVNWTDEFEIARQEAFDEYKRKRQNNA